MDYPFKAKMAQPIVLVNNGQSPSPKSNSTSVFATPKNGQNVLFENFLNQVRSGLGGNNFNQVSQPSYMQKFKSLSSVSGLNTPNSNNNPSNLSQLT